MNIQPPVDKRLEFIKQKLAPYTKRAYLVGGFVRDMLLEKSPQDMDIEIYDIAPEAFDALMAEIKALGVGKSFYVYKYQDIDLSLPRVESKVAPTHQGFEVEYCNDEKRASQRRDFTMNALMLNIFTYELLDFWGGVEDIKRKTIRLIDAKRFREDSLRVLRGARFSGQLGFVVEKETLKVMQDMSINGLSSQRIFWELQKMFISSYPEIALLQLHKLHLIKKLFGIDAEFSRVFEIALKIRDFYDNSLENLKEYIFLYVLLNELNVDIKRSLLAIDAPKIYYKMLLVSYKTLPISDEELLYISLDLPLKDWVGVCQKGLVKRAKDLGVFDEIFCGGVYPKDVINDGFSGKDISLELKKRKAQKIKEICE